MSETNFDAELLAQALQRVPCACPTLARLGSTQGSEPWRVANHVGGCPRCMAVVEAAVAPPAPSPSPRRWEALLARANAIFEEPTDNIIRIVVRSVKRALEVVEVVGSLVQPLPIRSDQQDGLVVRGSFEEHELTAHLATLADGRFRLVVDVRAQGAPSEEVRVTLLRESRELESCLAHYGRVTFGAMAPGDYRVSIDADHQRIGAIDITFQDAVSSASGL